MNDREQVVCKWLRKLCPSRNWDYLGEVEHYWIGEMCDEIVALERDGQETPTTTSDGRITDELRELARRKSFTWGAELTAIADRIDAAHDDALQREHETAYDAGYDEAMKSCENWAAGHEDEMAEHGWYRALDADKKPMRLGDKAEGMNGTFTVHELKFTAGGCTTWDGVAMLTVHVDECHHHHEPTVEDMLREMHMELDKVTALYVGEAIDSDERGSDEARIFAEYAAKLRLAGDE